MLIIRPQQMEVLEQHQLRCFKSRLQSHLQQLAGCMPARHLQLLIDRSVADAARFSLVREADVARFAEIVALHGGPAEHPQELPRGALAILMAYGATADAKLQRLQAWMAARAAAAEGSGG